MNASKVSGTDFKLTYITGCPRSGTENHFFILLWLQSKLLFSPYTGDLLDLHQWVPFCVQVFSSLCFRFGSPTHCNAVQPLKSSAGLLWANKWAWWREQRCKLTQTHTEQRRKLCDFTHTHSIDAHGTQDTEQKRKLSDFTRTDKRALGRLLGCSGNLKSPTVSKQNTLDTNAI